MTANLRFPLVARSLAAFGVSVFLVATAASAGGGPIQVARVIPYQDESRIPEKIVAECDELGEKLGRFVNEYATKYDVTMTQVDEVDPTSKGRVLVVEITDALSAGNAFIGHRKSMSAHAELFDGGVSKGSIDFTRDSGGGFAGGYKSSCSVLGRCTKALGKDIAGWLRDHQ